MIEKHEMESLHRAYVQAIASAARVFISKAEFDYGIDGTFHQTQARVEPTGKRRLFQTGYNLDFQMKSSTTGWTTQGSNITFDLEAKTYNDLITRHVESQNNVWSTPCILIVFCLPVNRTLWTDCNEDRLLIQKCCYWTYLKTGITRNAKTERITIARSNLFTPIALLNLLTEVQTMSTGIFN